MKNALFRFCIVVAALTMSLGPAGEAMLAQEAATAQVAKPDSAHGVQVADMDRATDPGDDFYTFANGGWMARTELPNDVPAYSASSEVLIRVSEQLFEIIGSLEPDPDTPQGKVRLLFDQVLDTEIRNEQGIDPIRPLLDDIQAITSIEDGLAFQEDSDSESLFGLFAPFAAASPADATTTVAWMAGPNLSLPSEDYYFDDSEDSENVRDAWIETTTQLLMLLGYSEDEASTAAETVLDFEMELAEAKTPDEVLSTDPGIRNNPRTVEELESIMPSFDWEDFIERTELPDDVTTIHVADIAYLEALEDILSNADPLTLQYLFVTQLVWEFSPYLTTEIEDTAFSFTGPVLLGVGEQQHPAERALDLVHSSFPDTLGEAYVAEAFPPEARIEAEALVDNLIAAYRIRIQESAWMSEDTRARALEKLDLMNIQVGYPEEWDTYDDVIIGDSLFESVANTYDATNEQSLGRIGRSVDPLEWPMAAYEVNAAYAPSRNMIVLPAGILQAPYFDPEADPASNYGAIGAIIGHEITHGFDISGSQYDGYGNLVSWWTEDDFAAFSALNEEVVAQYEAIEVLPGLMVDGELTVTENVADMGGVQVAYDAMLTALGARGKSRLPSQEQRFFVAFAQIWRSKSTPEFLEYIVASDEHAPHMVRAVQPARNMDEFYDAFDIGPGDPEYLAPEDRIVIW